jgi:hypothetical protein
MQAAKIDKVCFVIEHFMQWFNEKTEAASPSNLVAMGQKLGAFTASWPVCGKSLVQAVCEVQSPPAQNFYPIHGCLRRLGAG